MNMNSNIHSITTDEEGSIHIGTFRLTKNNIMYGYDCIVTDIW